MKTSIRDENRTRTSRMWSDCLACGAYESIT